MFNTTHTLEHTAATTPQRRLGILYGQANYHSTSLQTTQLSKILEQHFSVSAIRINSSPNKKWSLQANRLYKNLLLPLARKPRLDYVLYGNDGFADLSHWPGTTVLYWYDAPADWSKQRPSIRNWAHWLRYKNLQVATFIFAVSNAQVKVAKALRPGREESVQYLPGGVDCTVFDPKHFDGMGVKKKYNLPAKPVVGYLGYIGLVAGRYAGQCLADIAPALLAKQNVHFLIVGFGPGLKLFQQQVVASGVADHFTFTGHVPHELLPDYLAAMDICIDTLEEGFHSEARSEVKLKHYMAMGRACVATAIGENCVDLDNGGCGVLVAPDNNDLLRGIQLCLSDADLRQRLGHAARKRAEAVYDWPRLGAQMISVLKANKSLAAAG